jgi:hypothetical protein
MIILFLSSRHAVPQGSDEGGLISLLSGRTCCDDGMRMAAVAEVKERHIMSRREVGSAKASTNKTSLFLVKNPSESVVRLTMKRINVHLTTEEKRRRSIYAYLA